ncbi:MAG: squalene/phytoene synthase family protein [Rickettsiales bacterium]
MTSPSSLSQLRDVDPSLYFSAMFAPKGVADAYLALYRLQAELARVPSRTTEPVAAHIRLEWWREALGELYRGPARNYDLLRQIKPLIKRYPYAMEQERLFEAVDAALLRADTRDLPDVTSWRRYAKNTEAPALKIAAACTAAGLEGGEAYAECVAGIRGMARSLIPTKEEAAKRLLLWPDSVFKNAGATKTEAIEGINDAGVSKAGKALSVEIRRDLNAAEFIRKSLPEKARKRLFPLRALAIVAERRVRRFERNGCLPKDDAPQSLLEPWLAVRLLWENTVRR